MAEEEFYRNLVMAGARGHVQRAAAATRASQPPGGGDPGFANKLLESWAYGLKSGQEVQDDAFLAHKAGARGGLLTDLAKLGNWGKNPQNVATQLMDLVKRHFALVLVPIFVCLVPLLVNKSNTEDIGPKLCPFGFILPHVWFSWMYENFNEEFHLRFIGATAAGAAARLGRFWNTVHPNDPRRSPLFRRLHFATHCIPIGLHGDGVPCTKRNSLDVTSLFGILGTGLAMDMIMYICGYFRTTLVDMYEEFPGGTTKSAVYRVIVHSMIALEQGVWPTHDYLGNEWTEEPFASKAGTLLAGGYFAHLWLFRADSEYHVNYLGLPGHWSSNAPCIACRADKSVDHNGNRMPSHHLNFSRASTWPDTVFTVMETYFEHCRARGKDINLLLLPREQGGLGCHILIFSRDTLHVLDLGPTPHSLGSTLWLMVYGDMVVAGDPSEALRIIFQDINDIYRRRKTPTTFTNIELSMFTDPTAPSKAPPLLSGKAAECRHLTPILCEVFDKYAPRDEYHNHVREMLTALTEIYEVLDFKDADGGIPPFLSEAACNELRSIIERYLLHYTFLEQLALEADRMIFHMVSKFHSVYHVGYESQFGHPSSARTYANEHYVGKVSIVGMSNRYAIAVERRPLTICEKMALGRCMSLSIRYNS